MRKFLLILCLLAIGTIVAEGIDGRLERLVSAQRAAVGPVQKSQRSVAAGQEALAGQKYAEAATAFLEALSANPSDVETYYRLAVAFAGAKRFTDTKRALAMYMEFQDEDGKTRINNRFARESLPGGPFNLFLTEYQQGLISNRAWGAGPDDAYGIATGTRDTYFAKARARASDSAIEQKNNAMMQATCRAAAKSIGNTAVLHAIARQTLEKVKKTSGRVQIGGVVCTVAGESTNCAGIVRPGMMDCQGVGPGGSYSECECGTFLRVPGGETAVKYLGD